MDKEDRFICLAYYHLGAALQKVAAARLQNRPPGDEAYRLAKDDLDKAVAALDGKIWQPTVDPQHAELGKKGS